MGCNTYLSVSSGNSLKARMNYVRDQGGHYLQGRKTSFYESIKLSAQIY